MPISEYEDALRRRQAYMRNRDERKRKHLEYYLANKTLISKRSKRYRRQVRSGMKVPMLRAKAGLGYVVVGSKPPKGSGSVASFVRKMVSS